MNGIRSEEYFSESKDAADRALELDPDNTRALLARGYVALFWEWDWEAAERWYRRYFEVNPNPIWGSFYHWYVGDYDEAIRTFEAAELRTPNSLMLKDQLGDLYACAGEYERATAQFQKVLELDPAFLPVIQLKLAMIHMQQGKPAEALDEFQRTKELGVPESLPVRQLKGAVYAHLGREDEARQIMVEIEATHGVARLRHEYAAPRQEPARQASLVFLTRLMLYVALDETDSLIAELEAAYRRREAGLLTLQCMSYYKQLLDVPRAKQIIQRIGLWRT